MAALALAWLMVVLVHAAQARTLTQTADASTLLLSLPAAATNWDAATAALAGASWSGDAPCGNRSGVSWKGVTCSAGGDVVRLQLAGLGLQGSLPAQLAALPSLALLNLRGNAFSGSLPAAWTAAAAFPSLSSADLGRNLLQGTLPATLPRLASRAISIDGNSFSGTLPPGWTSASLELLDASNNSLTGELPMTWSLPALVTLRLQGNNLSGLIPYDRWDSGALAEPAELEARPGNDALCGAVLPVDPGLASSAPQQPGNQSTSLVLRQRDLFTSGSSVTITNWLGSCMHPCEGAELALGPAWVQAANLPWPPAIQTNSYDISYTYNMSISDLLTLNPDLASKQHDDTLNLPCYPASEAQAVQQMHYRGSDVAFGKFAGGNQLDGADGLDGAAAASQVVLSWPGSNEPQREGGAYRGSLAAAAGGGPPAVVEPVYWFVDTLAPFHVVSVTLIAGPEGLKNASIYLGSDSASVFGNALVASGIDVAPWQEVAIPANVTVGRYVVVYTGMLSEGRMSLADVQVYTYETNSAANMPLSVSALTCIDRGGASDALHSLVDNNASTCQLVQADPSNSDQPITAWVFVDIGYIATVSSIAVAAGDATPPGLSATVVVTRHADDTPSDDVQCGGPLLLQPGGWAVGGCNLTGRYVTIDIATASPQVHVQVCEVQVSLAAQPQSAPATDGSAATAGDVVIGDGSSGGTSTGEVAGIVVGCVAGAAVLAALLVMGVRYGRWRRRYVSGQRRVSAALAGGKSSPPSPASEDGGRQGPGDSEDGGSRSDLQLAVVGQAAGGGGDVPVTRQHSGGALSLAAKASRRVSSEWGMMGAFTRTALGRAKEQPQLSQAGPLPGSTEFQTSLFARAPTTDSSSPPSERDPGQLSPGVADIKPQDIQLIEVVGEGSFGQVWRARYFGAVVAVKVFGSKAGASPAASPAASSSPAEDGGAPVGALQREALLMSQLRHPNICLYLGACQRPPSLVMQFCERKSLDVVLSSALSSTQLAQHLTWARLLGMVHDAANGMLYLHTRSPPIAHRDLKSANLLLDRNWEVKVADFNLSRSLEHNKAASTVVLTNPRWLAPEVMDGTPGHLPADVWAFGTVMWEVLTWRLPFLELNTFQIITLVQREGGGSLQPPAADELPAGRFEGLARYVRLMQECRATDPAARPTFEAVVPELRALLEAEVKRSRAARSTTRARKSVRNVSAGGAYCAMGAALKQRQLAMQAAAQQQQAGSPQPDAAAQPGLPPPDAAAQQAVSPQPDATAQPGVPQPDVAPQQAGPQPAALLQQAPPGLPVLHF